MFRSLKWLIFQWGRLKSLFYNWARSLFLRVKWGIKNPFKVLSRIKNWLFSKPRTLKTLLSVKTWLILGLGASNLFVLSFVLNTYLQSSGVTLYSTVDIKSLVTRECEDQVEKVMQGTAVSQVCRIELKKRHKGAQYTQSTQFKIKKENGKLIITTEETGLSDRTKHAEEMESTFCENCDREELAHNQELVTVMQEIVAMATKQEEAITDKLNEVREEYERAKISERQAKVKERRCEGYWNEDEKIYEEYDTEERLDCKMSKLARMTSQEKDWYYQNTLRDEFWNIALHEEEDPHFIMDELNRIRLNPYQFSPRSQFSAGLIGNYVRWRDRYEDLESDYQRNLLVDHIVRDASGLAAHLGQQGRADLLHLQTGLNRHFDMAGSRLNSVITRTTPSPSHIPTSYSPNQGQINTLDLY